jgi:hypothetical protein
MPNLSEGRNFFKKNIPNLIPKARTKRDPVRSTLEPRLLSAAQAAFYLAIPLHTFQKLQLPYCVIAGLERYDRRRLDQLVDELSGFAEDTPEAAFDRFLAAQPKLDREASTTVPPTVMFRGKSKR